jgi:3-hydroxyisobutyrate dehydrogenase-like beta-hydroxyacid dehydrogenase
MNKVKKQNLSVALILSGKTLTEFANQLGASPQAIDQVANGRTKSRMLHSKIMRFINREFKKAKIDLSERMAA